MLCVRFGIPAAVLASFRLAMGPLGWVLVAVLGIVAPGAASPFGADEEREGSDRVNCPVWVADGGRWAP
jgi:hypothetical protein